MKISNKIVMALCLMLFFISEASAAVYRTGLQQFQYKCNSNAEADLTMRAAAITDASKLDIVEKTLMASIDGTSNVNNPVTGKTWKWADVTTYGYEGVVWLEPGTYTFWGQYDDGGAVVINDNVIYTHSNKSGYSNKPKEGSLVVDVAGWHDFRGYVWDWSGGKKPCGSAKSAIQMKKDGGDWVLDMAGVPARFKTGEEYLVIKDVLPTETPTVISLVVEATFPEGVTAQVCSLASNGYIGDAVKEKWTTASAVQEVVGTGAAQELTLTVDLTQLTDAYFVVYSESECTEDLLETYAADPTWNKKYAYSNIIRMKDVDLSAPKISELAFTENDDGTYTISVEFLENTGELGVVYVSGDTVITNVLTSAAVAGTEYTTTTASLPKDKTYDFFVYAVNVLGTEDIKEGVVFYNGELSIEKLSDANELYAVPGSFRISRTDSAHDLVVNISISGTAIAGQTYEELSTTVTIPAGETYADVVVTPLFDTDINFDSTVIVTLEDANYYNIASDAAVSQLTIANVAPPKGYNTWVATEEGLASNPHNWSLGHTPLASEDILFDGYFSTANCIWDVDATHTVASWTQEANYSGAVTFQTTFPGLGFEQFVIAGDAVIDSGIWTHSENSDTEVYRLAVSVGGDLTLAAAASIDVRLKGFAAKKYYPGAAAGVHAGGSSKGDKVYGDLYEPINLGSGSENAGGGAVHLVVGGDAILEGLITTQSQKEEEDSDYCGAPGSIYIKANTISGEGEILANSNNLRSSGGRISLVVTGDNKLAKDRSKLNAQGNVYNTRGGAGTILVKTTAEAYGILYIDNVVRSNYYINHYPSHNEVTLIPEGENWIVDGIVFANEGILAVQEGTTLTLPNGFASISGSSHKAGLLYNGGTIVAADADEATDTAIIQSKWVFQANEQFVFPGNLIVKDEGAVGCVRLRQITNVVYGCDVMVAGDMTVEETGFMYADVTGHTHGGYDWSREYYGDAYAYGGQLAMSTNGVYGSILNPNMPGSYGGANDGNDQNLGGGLIKVTVEGTLALDGKATAIGGQSNNVRGTGGAFNITAGSLIGTGSIAIHGYNASSTPNGDDKRTLVGIRSKRNVKAASAGGRVAIRLTDSSATLPDYWLTSAAVKSYGGVYTNSSTKVQDDPFCASAGTVYIQTANEAEGAGTIYIRNNNMITNPAYTPIPSVKYNPDENLDKASLHISEAGRVRICQEELKLNILTVEETSVIDLFGSTLSVTRAKIGSKSLGAGVYEPSDFADNLVDTSEAGGGTIVVLGEGTLIILR